MLKVALNTIIHPNPHSTQISPVFLKKNNPQEKWYYLFVFFLSLLKRINLMLPQNLHFVVFLQSSTRDLISCAGWNMYTSIYSDHSEIWMCFNDWWRVFWMVKDVPKKKALNSQFLWFCKKKKKLKSILIKLSVGCILNLLYKLDLPKILSKKILAGFRVKVLI